MGRLVDLTGRRFGILTVVGKAQRDSKNEYTKWDCLCDCGKTVKVYGNNLVRGDTRSCGCFNDKRRFERYDDITGMKFGRLTVLRYAGAGTRWLCKCSCGNEVIVLATSLKTGNTKSCGCFALEERKRLNTIHGLCYTKEYVYSYNRQRAEKKKKIDIEWTREMEIEIHRLFPKCVVCSGTDRLAVDHVRPMDLGYSLKPGNATVLCKSCNSKKRIKMPETLPEPMRSLILDSAEKFRLHWESLRG